MANFRYRAVNSDGIVVSGVQQCASLRELEYRILRLNLELISAKEDRSLLPSLVSKKISRRDLINFCFHLDQMLSSGVPLIDALGDMQLSLAPDYIADVVGVLANDIKEGKTLSEALTVFPDVFNTSFVSLVFAGEQSGELSQVMKNLTESLRWQDELLAKTKNALTLPSFVGLVVFAVVFFLMTFLVPKMTTFIASMGQELPLHTRALMGVSQFFVGYWYVVLGVPIVLFAVLRYAVKHSLKAQLWADHLKLTLWLIGPILEKIILARFVNYLALLYNAGVPILDSLAITETVVGNKIIERELKKIRGLISQGTSIALAFEMVPLFPRLVLSMISVGEKTGDLGTSLLNVSYFYKRDVDDAISRIQSLIEPLMTVILGTIIGWVIVSVLGPIYDLIANIKI